MKYKNIYNGKEWTNDDTLIVALHKKEYRKYMKGFISDMHHINSNALLDTIERMISIANNVKNGEEFDGIKYTAWNYNIIIRPFIRDGVHVVCDMYTFPGKVCIYLHNPTQEDYLNIKRIFVDHEESIEKSKYTLSYDDFLYMFNHSEYVFNKSCIYCEYYWEGISNYMWQQYAYSFTPRRMEEFYQGETEEHIKKKIRGSGYLMCPECFHITPIIYRFNITIDTGEYCDIRMADTFGLQCPKCNAYVYSGIIDSRIAEAISILNKKGYRTEYSCAGHYDDNYHVSCIYERKDDIYQLDDIESEPYIKFYGGKKPINSVPKGWFYDKEYNAIYCKESNSRIQAKNMYYLLRWAKRLPSIK